MSYLDCQQFIELEEKVLNSLPCYGLMIDMFKAMDTAEKECGLDNDGYKRSHVQAALMTLIENGKVIENCGMVGRATPIDAAVIKQY